MGKSFVVSTFTKERMKAAGYVGVKEHKFKLPAGPWSSDKKMKEIGSWNLFFFLRDTEGFCIYLLGKVMGVSVLLPVLGILLIKNSGSIHQCWLGLMK
jgi:hypothetical protein